MNSGQREGCQQTYGGEKSCVGVTETYKQFGVAEASIVKQRDLRSQ